MLSFTIIYCLDYKDDAGWPKLSVTNYVLREIIGRQLRTYAHFGEFPGERNEYKAIFVSPSGSTIWQRGLTEIEFPLEESVYNSMVAGSIPHQTYFGLRFEIKDPVEV